MPYATWIEWESLHNEYEILNSPHLHTSETLPEETEKIRIFRDDNYNIKGFITGEFKNLDEIKILEPEPAPIGSFVELKDLKIVDYDNEYTINQIVGSSSATLKHFKYKFSAHSVCRKFRNPAKTAWLTEYFLNGPQNKVFSSAINYETITTYKKKLSTVKYNDLPDVVLKSLNENNITFTGKEKGAMSGFNYSLIKFKNEKDEENYFIIQNVSNDLGPEWTNKIAIEYRKEWGIPDLEDRKKINEIISFILGRQLLKIGHSRFDKKGYHIENFAVNPNLPSSLNIRSVCNLPDTPPLKINPFNAETLIEPILNPLIGSYLNLRDELNMDSVFWRYWLANALNFDSSIILLASGIETLSTSWYKSKNSKNKGKYLEKEKFDRLLEDEFDLIENKLKGQKYKDRILSRIKNSFNMGGNESLNNFFKEIDLVVGPVENKAIRDRNRPVHGHILDPKESESFFKSIGAYHTLFNRTILKILGFEGKYIDYYTQDYPERNLDEPIPQDPK